MKENFLVDLGQTTSVSCRLLNAAGWLLRIALAAGFLSAVADRFGLWGPSGNPGVSWGNMIRFSAYVGKLNWFAPAIVIPLLAWVSTIAETLLAFGLLIGWQLRWFALASALLLLSFAATMTLALGVKPPLDYSVFTAAAAAFLLFAIQPVRDTNGPRNSAQ